MTDLFQNTDSQETIETIDPNKDYFAELVGEGKKFSDPKELARGKAESDAFITRLQRELAGIRAELQTRTTLEDALTRITGTQSNTMTSTSQTNHNGDDTDSNRAALSPEQIAEIVDRKVAEKDSQRVAQANIATVQSKLTEAFGANYVTTLNEVTNALGMTKEQVNQMAASQPQVLLRLVGVDKPQAPAPKGPDLFTPPTSRMSTPTGNSGTERNKAFYDTIKRTDKARYWSAEVQNQMHKDALRMGEQFFT